MVEYKNLSLLLAYLKEDEIFCDVGANIGTYSVILSKINKCKSICFEPDLNCYNQLNRHIDANKLESKVTAENMICSENNIEKSFFSGKDTLGSIDLSNKSGKKKSTSLDSYFFNKPLPNVLKIDTEGFESLVIEGSNNILNNKNSPNILLIELRGHGFRFGFDEFSIIKKIIGFGYNAYSFNNFFLKKIDLNDFKKGDYIFIKNIDEVEKRLKKFNFKLLFSD